MFGEAARQELATEFGVSVSTISDIATGRTWGWLEAASRPAGEPSGPGVGHVGGAGALDMLAGDEPW
jgi:hypothetical protein